MAAAEDGLVQAALAFRLHPGMCRSGAIGGPSSVGIFGKFQIDPCLTQSHR